jgi:pimeloyl-ACP methyl ester carboxylesterase
VKVASLPTAALALAFSLYPAARGATLDEAAAPGNNYAKAEFRLWYPDGAAPVRAVVVLVPGSNGDGRPMADDAAWQAFAVKHKLALVGCRFTDKPHDQGFLEDYANVSQGSGQALLDTLNAFAARAGHPELGNAPLLLWGMSAGGQFNYEFAAWKPERVAAFVVNKGGIYYTALTQRASREVPGMLFIGGKDLESRIQTITGLFAVNRRAGALWALAEEPGAAHVVGRSRDLSFIFFEDVLSLRLGDDGGLKRLTEKAGYLGDPKSKTVRPMSDGNAPSYPTSWLPTERVARAWAAMLTEQSFDGSPIDGSPKQD